MHRVSNGNLIVLKWQNIPVISNIKYTDIYMYIYIYKPGEAIYFIFSRGIFRDLSFLLEVPIFTKNSILDVGKGSEYVVA